MVTLRGGAVGAVSHGQEKKFDSETPGPILDEED